MQADMLPHDRVDPLGLDSALFAQRWLCDGRPGGARAALAAYSHAFRAGQAAAIGATVAPLARVERSDSPEGEVVKFTQRVAGRTAQDPELQTESVLIPMIGTRRVRSYTLCVSSQVGCAMGCVFCQTAQMGLVRSLSAAEIVGQWWAAQHAIERPDPGAAIRNIVFMGMGEPLDNLQQVLGAVGVLTDTRGPAVAISRVTLSTVGRVDGLRLLAQRVRQPGWHRLRLAVSLNAPDDATRSALMPINRAMPLAALRAELESWPVFSGTHQCLEYVLIPGVNDRPEHAEMVASFVLGSEFAASAGAGAGGRYAGPTYAGPRLRAMVNLIPYNPRQGSPWPAGDEETAERFMERLKGFGVFVKRRRTKGRLTMAACGQLGTLALGRRRVPLRVSAAAAGAQGVAGGGGGIAAENDA
ncbi:MAG: RNA methyltransferase [Planctomyces sp.]|nr:RNA methyltransferase [Planctomyces sp.]